MKWSIGISMFNRFSEFDSNNIDIKSIKKINDKDNNLNNKYIKENIVMKKMKVDK